MNTIEILQAFLSKEYQDATDMGSAMKPAPVLNDADVAQVKEELGRELSPFLKSLYCTIGNGGFGPAYGLLGLHYGPKNEDGLNAIDLYHSFRAPDPDDPHWIWPEDYIPLVHLGCAMFLCAHISDAEASVIWFEPNPHEYAQPWTDSFFPLRVNLAGLLDAWMNGEEFTDLVAE